MFRYMKGRVNVTDNTEPLKPRKSKGTGLLMGDLP